MDNSKEERRKSVRIKKALIARYSYTVNKDTKKWDETMLKDISETGMCVTTTQSFLPNDTVTFLIKIPTEPLEWLELTGRVIACESEKFISMADKAGAYTTRIEFINLQETQKKNISDYIKWFLSKPH